jgi:hypothetical protein
MARLFLTFDVDDDGCLAYLLNSVGKATYFVPLDFARKHTDLTRIIVENGNELGLMGFPRDKAKLEKLARTKIRGFRGKWDEDVETAGFDYFSPVRKSGGAIKTVWEIPVNVNHLLRLGPHFLLKGDAVFRFRAKEFDDKRTRERFEKFFMRRETGGDYFGLLRELV